MKYIDKKADLRWWLPSITRKASIITLLALLMLFINFRITRVRAYQAVEYQTSIEVEEVPITRQEIQKQEAPKPQLAEVIEADDEEVADTVELAETGLDITEIPPPIQVEEEIEFFKVEIKPIVLSRIKPKYPPIAKKSGLEGAVIIEFVVDTTGEVLKGSAKVVSARPEGVFEEAALKAIYQWKFSSGQQRDRKVRVRWQQPIRFKLK